MKESNRYKKISRGILRCKLLKASKDMEFIKDCKETMRDFEVIDREPLDQQEVKNKNYPE